MCDLIRKQLVMRGMSHFALRICCAHEIVDEEHTAQGIVELVNGIDARIKSLAAEFKAGMDAVGYKWVELYESKGDLCPCVSIGNDGSLDAVCSGDLHAPFDSGVVKGVCDTLGMELKEVVRDDA